MTNHTRKITALIASTALLGAGGLGAAQAATQSGDNASSPNTKRHDGRRGPQPMPAATLAKIADAIGVTSTQLKAAMDATRPAKPADGGPGQRGDRGARLATDLASALGVDVASVKEILDANRPAKPAQRPDGKRGARPPRPDSTALIAALAKGLDLDTAAVKAAFDKLEATHRTEHQAREAAMYAAIAKELGVDSAKVKAAFEANRPAKPAHAR